jgi:hypothetical protein
MGNGGMERRMGWYERRGLVRELAQHQVPPDAVWAKEGFQREFTFVGRSFFSFCRPILLWLKLSRYLSQSRRGAASEDAGTQRHTVSLDMGRTPERPRTFPCAVHCCTRVEKQCGEWEGESADANASGSRASLRASSIIAVALHAAPARQRRQCG